MVAVGDPIDPSDYLGALDTLSTRADTKDTQVTGILAALVARVEAPNVTLPGRTGTINGSLTNLIVQCGSFTGNTDGTGQLTINYPTFFPGGILAVIPVNGDTSAAQFVLGVEIVNTTGFVVKCADFAGADFASHAVRVDWIALGW